MLDWGVTYNLSPRECPVACSAENRSARFQRGRMVARTMETQPGTGSGTVPEPDSGFSHFMESDPQFAPPYGAIAYLSHQQGLENKIIQPEFNPLPRQGTIRCRKRLGGMLRYYCRKTA